MVLNSYMFTILPKNLLIVLNNLSLSSIYKDKRYLPLLYTYLYIYNNEK